MLDREISVKTPEKIAAFDIEVDATAGFPLSENPVGRVLAISLFDGEDEIFICDNDEAEMFRQFNKALEQYDFIFGWNSAAFDYPYLIARAKAVGEPIRRIFFQHLDLFGIYMTYFKREETEFRIQSEELKAMHSLPTHSISSSMNSIRRIERCGDRHIKCISKCVGSEFNQKN